MAQRFDIGRALTRPLPRLQPVAESLFSQTRLGEVMRQQFRLHLRYQHDAGQTLFQSVLCYGSYFIGMNDPMSFNQLTPGVYAPFVKHAWLLAGWLALLGVCGWCFFGGTRRRDSSDTMRFGRGLLAFWP